MWRNGIPSRLRSYVWRRLIENKLDINPETYVRCLDLAHSTFGVFRGIDEDEKTRLDSIGSSSPPCSPKRRDDAPPRSRKSLSPPTIESETTTDSEAMPKDEENKEIPPQEAITADSETRYDTGKNKEAPPQHEFAMDSETKPETDKENEEAQDEASAEVFVIYSCLTILGK